MDWCKCSNFARMRIGRSCGGRSRCSGYKIFWFEFYTRWESCKTNWTVVILKFFSKFFFVSVGQFATVTEKTVIAMILSRTLTQGDYGSYQQVWLYYNTLLPIFSLGIPSSLLYFIPRSAPKDRKTIAYYSLGTLELFGIVFSLVTFFTATMVADQFSNPDLVTYLRIFSLYPLFSLAPRGFNFLLISLDKQKVAAIFSILFSGTTILFVSLPTLFKHPVLYSLIGAVLSGAIFFAVFVIFLYKYFKGEKLYWDRHLLWSQLAYSLPIGLSSVVGTFSTQLNRLVISTSFSPHVFAVFNNGAFEIPFVGLLTGSLMTVLIPEFVVRLKNNETMEAVWRLWNNASLKTALILYPLIVYSFIFSEEIIILLFSNKYLESVPIFRIFLIATFVRVTQYSSLIQALGKTKLMLLTSIIGLISNLVLSWILVNTMGVYGPAWANVITVYIWMLVYLLMIANLTNSSLLLVMPWIGLLKVLVLSIIPGLGIILLRYANLSIFLELIFGAVIYAMLYIVLLIVTHEINVKELQQFTRRRIQAFIRRPR